MGCGISRMDEVLGWTYISLCQQNDRAVNQLVLFLSQHKVQKKWWEKAVEPWAQMDKGPPTPAHLHWPHAYNHRYVPPLHQATNLKYLAMAMVLLISGHFERRRVFAREAV
jgi:hypothetical protein